MNVGRTWLGSDLTAIEVRDLDAGPVRELHQSRAAVVGLTIVGIRDSRAIDLNFVAARYS